MDLEFVSRVAAALRNDSIHDDILIANDSTDHPMTEIEELITSLQIKSSRCRIPEVPDTLQHLSVKCVLKNAKNFLQINKNNLFSAGCNNPFAYLPNMVVQLLLDALANDRFSFENFGTEYCFLLQLLNPQVLELVVNRRSSSKAALFKHLLLNCPRIQSVHIDSQVWKDYVVLPRLKATHIYKMMSLQWPNLTCLCQSSTESKDSSVSSDAILKEIRTHLPNLRVLSITLSCGNLTMEGVKHLTEMKKLVHLQLFAPTIKDVTLLVHAAGLTPSLEQFDFWQHREHHDLKKLSASFVDLYGTLYPEKKLATNKLWFDSDLKNKWPKCLSVSWLQFEHKPGNNFDSKNLLDGNNCSVKKMSIVGAVPSKVYPLVEKFGPTGLVRLLIRCPVYNGEDIPVEPLDPYRVVAACPNVQVLNMQGDYETNFTYKVTPEHFQNYEYFEIIFIDFAPLRMPAVLDLYRMYLIGSKRFARKLVVRSEEVLDLLLSMIEQNVPTCFDQVESITFDVFRSSSSAEQLLNKILQLAFLLVTRSPYLKDVSVYCIRERINFRQHKPCKWFSTFLHRLHIAVYYAHHLFAMSPPESWPKEEYTYSHTIGD